MDVKKLLYTFAAGALFGFGGNAVAVEGYVTDGIGDVARDAAGECVTTEFWSRDNAIAECHPQLVQRDEVAAFEEPRRRTEMISLEADTTFDFDEATLTDEGKAELDEIAERAKDAQDPRIRIVGYTDQIGPESYNQELSEKRARAVEEYLVKQGISSETIQTAARGESDPVVSCEGLQGDALIECLRPNRRSEVEFSAFEVIEEEPQQEQDLQQEQNL
ncbi:OmpA family protein [Thiohalomonas denitrificans]|uniref:OmpA-OmpF porin, OOP family n=1 Tax=Thiohalomonas denitrificans TaxID=415747 RepID=A0A1G5Q7I5_9GAMM|nr:OmpA family protein [Thiohalomonas denitrificans]SCZ57803.1 OmpA-OmpF porin, OOP family [Thiohalomonas denitrificans]